MSQCCLLVTNPKWPVLQSSYRRLNSLLILEFFRRDEQAQFPGWRSNVTPPFDAEFDTGESRGGEAGVLASQRFGQIFKARVVSDQKYRVQ